MGWLTWTWRPRWPWASPARDTVDFRNVIVFFWPRPWHIEIRHRVKKTSTINLSGFETLKLKIRRLKLWKPTVGVGLLVSNQERRALVVSRINRGSTCRFCFLYVSISIEFRCSCFRRNARDSCRRGD